MTQSSINRRAVLFTGAAVALALDPLAAFAQASVEDKFKASPFRKISDADWKKKLPGQSYGILRHEDTEYGNTGPFLNEKRKGTYFCLGCDLPLFKSEWKYDHDGWPSFFDVIKTNVSIKHDTSHGMDRNEYHCAQCLGHHGHLFDDGPKPTGLRYCNNGYALKFVPA